MAAILTDIGSIVTAAIGWCGDFVTVVTSNPIVLLFVLIPVCGLGIGILKRLINL